MIHKKHTNVHEGCCYRETCTQNLEKCCYLKLEERKCLIGGCKEWDY